MAAPTLELDQSLLRGGQRLPRALVLRVLRAAGKHLPGKARTVHAAFVSEAEMRRLNKKHRGKDKVTDVLSFEGWDEILLCYPQAKRQARQMNHSVREECVFLLVHGLLHLYGYDHLVPKDAKRMFPLQEKILTALGVDPRL